MSLLSMGKGALKTAAGTLLPGSGLLAQGASYLKQPLQNAAASLTGQTQSTAVLNPYNLTPDQMKAQAAQQQPQQQATPPGTPQYAPPTTPQLGAPTPSASSQSFNTGNPQLDAFLANLPQVQQALGIGTETPDQKAARESQQAGLNRLLALQEQLLQSGAPSNTLAELDRAINDQTKALESTRPDELLKSMPGFTSGGITQGQLLRESASRADPISRTLSDLISSRSILGEQQQQQRQFLSDQMSGIQNAMSITDAINALNPSSGLPDKMKNDILSALVGQAFQDPLERSLKMAQLAKLQKQTANIGAGGVKLGAVAQKEVVNNNTVKSLALQALQQAQTQGGFKGIAGLGGGSLSQFFTKNFGTGTDTSGKNAGQDMRNLIGNIKGAIALARGGTSFTPNEQALLDTYTPTINESDASVTSKLNSLIQFIDLKNQNILQTSQGQYDFMQGAVDEYLAQNDL